MAGQRAKLGADAFHRLVVECGRKPKCDGARLHAVMLLSRRDQHINPR
jgi:hypothetical protein